MKLDLQVFGSTPLKSGGKYNWHLPKIESFGEQPFLTSHCRL
jgi:hypothetical protein